MKLALLLFSTALTTSAFAQPVATMSGVCRSLMFAPAEHSSGNLMWTTYSAGRGFPLTKRTPEGRLHSLEFRPRAKEPGVYEADYIAVSGTSVTEFGSITLNLLLGDSDTNGVPDVLEFSRAADVTVSGNIRPDYVRSSRVTRDEFTGTLQRDAGEFEGTYTLGMLAHYEPITAPFRLLSYDGSVEYQRGRINTMTMTLTPHRDGGETRSSTVRYRVLSADKILIPAQVVVIDGQMFRRHRAVLNRVGNRYVFVPNTRDGETRTPWKDYVSWIDQITDPTDTDSDGIPDLSDPDA